MEKGLIRAGHTTIGPLHHLNSSWIHYQISTISVLKQMRSQREEVLMSAVKNFSSDFLERLFLVSDICF